MTLRGAYKAKSLLGPPTSLGERIRRIRLAWGWTQINLAQALHADQQIISDWERNRSKPSGASLGALAGLLRISPEALETGKGFQIPDLPQSSIPGARMSRKQIQELLMILPGLSQGEILQVDASKEESESLKLKEILASIREAQKEGRQVWVVLGDPPKTGDPK